MSSILQGSWPTEALPQLMPRMPEPPDSKHVTEKDRWINTDKTDAKYSAHCCVQIYCLRFFQQLISINMFRIVHMPVLDHSAKFVYTLKAFTYRQTNMKATPGHNDQQGESEANQHALIPLAPCLSLPFPSPPPP